MSVPPADPAAKRYGLAFLTDQWEWEAELAADGFDQAKACARQALEKVVREETPTLACVTLLNAGVRIGVWDWVEHQAHWTPL